jgi:BirA family biotin operon repressor/biotin-[acetyl-CoA-carboxylase] ligase
MYRTKRCYLEKQATGYRIISLGSVDSTNAEALRQAAKGAADRTVVVAETQTAGRGRLDRRWHSPPGTGMYFSVILRPEDAVSLNLVPLAAGVSVVYAIRETCGVEAKIKWPNDVQINGKKVCGILCEAVEAGKIIIVGVGINLGKWKEQLPDDVSSRPVTTLEDETGEAVDRDRLLSRFLDEFRLLCEVRSVFETEAVIERVRASHEPFGGEVRVISGGEESVGTARGIDGEGRFLVEFSGGVTRAFVAGDVELIRPVK